MSDEMCDHPGVPKATRRRASHVRYCGACGTLLVCLRLGMVYMITGASLWVWVDVAVEQQRHRAARK